MRRAAARSHHVITTAELGAAGVSHRVIERLVRRGFLRRLSRGIYTTLPQEPLPCETRWFAAATAAGEDSGLSHSSGCELCGLLPRVPSGRVHVTAPNDIRVPGVATHRGRPELTTRHGIRVVTLPHLLVGLAGQVNHQTLRRAYDNAHQRRLLTESVKAQILALTPGRRGGARLAALVRAENLDSGLERRLRAILRVAGLPLPVFGHLVHLDDGTPHRIDAYWPEQRLALEVDHFHTHGDAGAFYRDRVRDRSLAALGITPVRATDRDLAEPAAMVADLWRLLARLAA